MDRNPGETSHKYGIHFQLLRSRPTTLKRAAPYRPRELPTENSGDPEQESDSDAWTKPKNKVARLIDTYDLGTAFGDRLEYLWTADGDERESLRALADRFNKRLLEAVMTDVGMSTLDDEVANLYRFLPARDPSVVETVLELDTTVITIVQLLFSVKLFTLKHDLE